MGKSYGKVIDRDLGLNKVLQQAKELSKNSRVAIGVRGDDGDDKKTGRTNNGDLVTPMKAPTLAQVASWMEYGTETIPERSFIRATMDRNQKKYTMMMVLLAGQILDPKVMMRVDTALGLAGEKVKVDIMAAITKGIDPALSPITIERKGSSKQLIDTGQLINAINYEVRLAAQYRKSLK